VRYQFVLSEIAIGLRRNLTMTVAGVITVAVMLTLFGSGLLVSKQVSLMKDFWYDKVQVSIFLCGEESSGGNCGGKAITDEQRRLLGDELRAVPLVEEVFYESKADAYERFKEQFKESPDLVQNVTADALPESYRVALKDPEQFEVVASAFRDRPGVETVQDQRALLEPFFRFARTLQWFAWAASIVLLLAAALLISVITRVAAMSRRRETGIMRLVGASNMYIQLPFLLEGVIAGVVGATFAMGALVAGKAWFIDARLRQDIQFTAWIGWDAVLATVPWLFVVGTVIAAVSSSLTLRRYLRV
jgi:cell division transport system permease protein